jgi:GNAT superfamily N-acetyltransferase
VTDRRPALRVRAAAPADADAVLTLATAFATSFRVEAPAFGASFAALLEDVGARVLVATDEDDRVVGYVLGFVHATFYANGPVAWVEEITVEAALRGRGIGRSLMDAFEAWAAERGARLVALATRRAAPFYGALGYEDSAVYFRKLLGER